MGEQLVGTVKHYFGEPHVAVVEIIAGELHVGDTIRVAALHCDFVQQVQSIDLEHTSVDSAKVGDNVRLRVSEPVREYDRVYRETRE